MLARARIAPRVRSLFCFGLAKARQDLLAHAGIVPRIKSFFRFDMAKECHSIPSRAVRAPGAGRFSDSVKLGHSSVCSPEQDAGLEGRSIFLFGLAKAHQWLLARVGIASSVSSVCCFGIAKARQSLLALAGIMPRVKSLFRIGLAKERQPITAHAGRKHGGKVFFPLWPG